VTLGYGKVTQGSLVWKSDPSALDYKYFYPIFVDGFREANPTVRLLAYLGAVDLLERNPGRVYETLPQIILPLKCSLCSPRRAAPERHRRDFLRGHFPEEAAEDRGSFRGTADAVLQAALAFAELVHHEEAVARSEARGPAGEGSGSPEGRGGCFAVGDRGAAGAAGEDGRQGARE